jgi:hypothetical protein
MKLTRTISRHIAVAAALGALFCFTFGPSLPAQQAISGKDSAPVKVKDLGDPEFVGKWTFDKAGSYDGWVIMPGAAAYSVTAGVCKIEAKTQRPVLDLKGPYKTVDIASVEIRMRCVEQQSPAAAAGAEGGEGAVGGAHSRTRVRPVYRGSRLYWATQTNADFDPSSSVEFHPACDGKFAVLTIDPTTHPNWKGLIYKFRLDVGDFPNHYEVDSISFRRTIHPEKGAAKRSADPGDAAAGAPPEKKP